jgi:hypothetical protein
LPPLTGAPGCQEIVPIERVSLSAALPLGPFGGGGGLPRPLRRPYRPTELRPRNKGQIQLFDRIAQRGEERANAALEREGAGAEFRGHDHAADFALKSFGAADAPASARGTLDRPLDLLIANPPADRTRLRRIAQGR